MNTRKLITSMAAAVMLSTGLAGVGTAMTSQPAQAATQSGSSISIRRRSVTATVNSDKPQLIAYDPSTNKFVKALDSTYVKGQTIPVYYAITATSTANGSSQNVTFYFLENRTVDGKSCMILIPSTSVTPASTVPTAEEFQKTAENDAKTVQDAYANRTIKSITVTPKSKKGAKIYYAYKKSAKSKKIVFKATNKKIKYGKKYKSSMIVKNGKSRYVYIGKKRYLKSTAVKVTNVKYSPLNLPDDIKNLIVNN
mgnify:FL=1